MTTNALTTKAATGEVVSMPPPSATSMMDIIARAASDPSVDVAKLEKLLDMAERVQAKTAKDAYAAAMSAAQAEMRRIAPDLNNIQTRSMYASYAKLDSMIRPIYTRHGFSMSFSSETPAPEMVRIIARVKHALGHEEMHSLDIPADGKGARGNDVMTKTHATMSAVTYGRRGLTKMIWNLAEGKELDDDGNGAAGNSPITDTEAAEINALIDDAKVDRKTFLEWIKADKVEAISARNFVKARDALVARKNLMADTKK